jgi:uncharacterized radical SAM protein YgiQ
LPYERRWHPIYDKDGGVPAYAEVKFSITAHRGCFGGCNFCAIISHQGRIIQRRSDESIIREAKILTKLPDFKGYIHDLGGPTANFHRTSCDMQLERGTCHGKQCLSPDVCHNLIVEHSGYMELLRKVRAIPGIKKVFIRSGIRFDYLMLAKDDFLQELCENHISGQLKIAPEHISDRVTRIMGKSSRNVYVRFVERFNRMNKKLGKKQFLVPYFMSSHPGCTLEDAIELAVFIKEMGYHPNPYAQKLVTQRSRQIGLIVPDIELNYYGFYYSYVNALRDHNAEEMKIQLDHMERIRDKVPKTIVEDCPINI